MNRVVNQITNRVLPRDPARPAAREPNERGRKRAMLLPGLISPKVLAQEYQDVTENGTNSVTQDKPCCRIRCAPSVSEPNHSKRTNSSWRHGGTWHIYHSKCRVSVWIMRARIIVMLCVASVSGFTPANLNELKSAKTTCLNEDASGNCPNFEATHGEIGTWDVSQVTSLSSSISTKTSLGRQPSDESFRRPVSTKTSAPGTSAE